MANTARPDTRAVAFTPQSLLSALESLPVVRHWHIALSGGADSVALLLAFHQIQSKLTAPVSAIHVDHSLHANSAKWTSFCVELSQRLGIPLSVEKITIEQESRESLEAAARRQRYQALGAYIKPQHALVTAHHQDDQAETFMLNLMRGSGPGGLAAMPVSRDFSEGYLRRPLLHFTRAQLINYLKAQDAHWIDDSSNSDQRFDRNFLRHTVLPALSGRWPSAKDAIATTAALQAEQRELNEALAEKDLDDIESFESASLTIAPLQKLSSARRRNTLRYWLLQRVQPSLVSRKILESIEQNLIAAATDSQPMVKLGEKQLLRFGGNIYCRELDNAPVPRAPMSWKLESDLVLDNPGLTLPAITLLNLFHGLKITDELSVQFRHGGERFRQQARQKSASLKKLFQHWQVPPWQRDKIPLIYFGDQLLAVWGYAVADDLFPPD